MERLSARGRRHEEEEEEKKEEEEEKEEKQYKEERPKLYSYFSHCGCIVFGPK